MSEGGLTVVATSERWKEQGVPAHLSNMSRLEKEQVTGTATCHLWIREYVHAQAAAMVDSRYDMIPPQRWHKNYIHLIHNYLFGKDNSSQTRYATPIWPRPEHKKKFIDVQSEREPFHLSTTPSFSCP